MNRQTNGQPTKRGKKSRHSATISCFMVALCTGAWVEMAQPSSVTGGLSLSIQIVERGAEALNKLLGSSTSIYRVIRQST